MGVTIPLPELQAAPPPQAAPVLDPLSEFQKAAELRTAAAQQQAIMAQTQGQQQQNQAQGLQLKDEMLYRQLAPQHTIKDANGKVTGMDFDGLYTDMQGHGANVLPFQAKQIELQQKILALGATQRQQVDAMHSDFEDALETTRKAYDQESKKAVPTSTPAPTAPSMGPVVPGTGGMPAGMLPNMPAAQKLMPAQPSPEIGASPAGTPESLGAPPPGAAPTASESAIQTAGENAPRPIGAQTQAVYQAQLLNLAKKWGPQAVAQLKPMLTDGKDIDQAEAEVGSIKEAQANADKTADIAKKTGEGIKARAEAEKANWLGSDGVFTNIKTGQVIHAGGSPTLQAFQEYISKGGDPLNFATDQAAREASNPALQAAKLHDATALKAAEQAISDGDPRAAAQLLTSGVVAPSQLISSRKPAFAQAAFTAAEQMQPGWNAQKAEGDFKVASSPAQVAFFGSAKSLTDPGGTLDQLKAAAKDIPQNQIPVFNTVADAIKASTGSGPIAKYAALTLGVADDYSKVMGGGQGSDTSRSQALNLIAAKQSPEQRDASIEGIRGAVSSQTNSRIGANPVLRKMYGGEAPQTQQTAGHKVGDIINQNGHNFKATKVDANGKVLAADPQ